MTIDSLIEEGNWLRFQSKGVDDLLAMQEQGVLAIATERTDLLALLPHLLGYVRHIDVLSDVPDPDVLWYLKDMATVLRGRIGEICDLLHISYDELGGSARVGVDITPFKPSPLHAQETFAVAS